MIRNIQNDKKLRMLEGWKRIPRELQQMTGWRVFGGHPFERAELVHRMTTHSCTPADSAAVKQPKSSETFRQRTSQRLGSESLDR